MTRSVVVVGASLGGVSTVRALRQGGFDERITVVGAEPDVPYDRPPLSKAFLAGTVQRHDLALLADDEDLSVDWLLGRRAVALLPRERAVRLDNGSHVSADHVVVATGAHARTLALRCPRRGVHVLRTLDDAVRLSDALRGQPRLVVIGGGFIGCEIASTARSLGLEVTIVEAAHLPLARAVGDRAARWLLALHGDNGVRVECGQQVTDILGGDTVTGIRLTDGRTLAADAVVVAVGTTAAVDWLAGSGVEIDPGTGGVVCDPSCTTSIPGVLAVGDVAAMDAPISGGRLRGEHWTGAVEQATIAASTLLGHHQHPPRRPPYFWSDQHGVRIQFAGRRADTDELRVVEGDPASGAFVGLYEPRRSASAVPTAVLGIGRPREFGRLRRQLVQPAS